MFSHKYDAMNILGVILICGIFGNGCHRCA
jgi:hypothetical protein